MSGSKESPVCAFCHGSGLLSSFKGKSRFLLSTEECPHCCGTGRDIPPSALGQKTVPGRQKKRRVR